MDCSRIYGIALAAQIAPYRWQRAFVEEEWPEVLIAPTGSGKTAGVTLGWAAWRLRAPEKTPRRLVWCLPMRTLVEQTAEAVKTWFRRLHAHDVAGALPKPEDVHVLMGGVEAAHWLDAPDRPAVLVGTQDMLLSRALMRGYASSRAVWPMEFALLHEDAQWVFDEVQLMDAGRATSAQLEAFRRWEADRAVNEDRPKGRPARSLWISATLEAGWLETVDFPAPIGDAVRRIDPRLERDERLGRLAAAKKALSRTSPAPASAKSADLSAYVSELAEQVLNAHQPGRMTLVIVNRVARAQDLHAALGKKLKKAPPGLVLVHGRFRPSDRRQAMDKIIGKSDNGGTDLIVVATQAVEAGVDISAAVLMTELAPWSSMVQRFGRANRYAELEDGADVRWIDLLAGDAEDDKTAAELSLPYSIEEMKAARERLLTLTDAAPANLPAPTHVDPPRRVIRRKDLEDLFDTDPDLTGFDVDISPYVRDANDTDVRVFWRDLSTLGDDPPHPYAEELCAVPIGAARKWLEKVRSREQGNALVFVRDPQWRRRDERTGHTPPGWTRLRENPWPGLTLLVDVKAGGYSEVFGFTGDLKHTPDPVTLPGASATAPETPPNPLPGISGETEGHDEDPRSAIGVPVTLSAHLGHVAAEAEALCKALEVDAETRAAVVRAARWHDLGKAHEVFQNTMRRGLEQCDVAADLLLAKTTGSGLRHERAYFRHELASALAFLAHENWSRAADLVAYLAAAHHGKVRMNLRALPRERPPADAGGPGARFARGIWENDELRPVDLGAGEQWEGGRLTLSVMELGWDEATRESWTERTRELLADFGPFRLAWMETLVRIADWRASGKEQRRLYDDC